MSKTDLAALICFLAMLVAVLLLALIETSPHTIPLLVSNPFIVAAIPLMLGGLGWMINEALRFWRESQRIADELHKEFSAPEMSRLRNLAEYYATRPHHKLHGSGVDKGDDAYISAMVVARFFERVAHAYARNWLARRFIRAHFSFLFGWWFEGYYRQALEMTKWPLYANLLRLSDALKRSKCDRYKSGAEEGPREIRETREDASTPVS